MSWFNPIPPHELGTTYTHTGWFAGLVPVYVGDVDTDCPRVVERNGCPKWWFSLIEGVFIVCCWVTSRTCDDFEPAFPILITGPIKP